MTITSEAFLDMIIVGIFKPLYRSNVRLVLI